MESTQPSAVEAVLLRHLAECRQERDALRGLADALETDHRHGNLAGRAEEAWYVYMAAREAMSA